jgi:hypothetical protein
MYMNGANEETAVAGRCAICGENHPAVVRKFQRHHYLAKVNAPNDTIWLCLNCHAIVTAAQNQGVAPKKRSSKASDEDKQSFQDISVGALLKRIGTIYEERGRGHGTD